jgi:hypothetical protein
MKELYKENYYNGSRIASVWYRLTKYIQPKEYYSSDFTPIETINPSKDKKGIVSFTLFGDEKSDRFWSYLVEPLLTNSRQISRILPGWGLRVYISSSLSSEVYDVLVDADYELVVMNENPKYPFIGLLWRFLVANENLPFLVCDADMLLDDNSWLLTNLNQVSDWLESDKTFFRRKNFPGNMLWPICAGGWGGRPTKDGRAAIPDIKDRLEKYNYNWFGSDESFLYKEVWPLFKKETYYTSYSVAEKGFWVVSVLIIVGVILFLILRKRT